MVAPTTIRSNATTDTNTNTAYQTVDGMAGERLVFRRRAEAAEEPFFPQRPPGSPDGGGKAKRRMLFVFDVSGSMYRFVDVDSFCWILRRTGSPGPLTPLI